MYGNGHFGFTMAFMSLIMIPVGYSVEAVFAILLGSAYSYLPDRDISWGVKHRGVTHSIGFALLTGVLTGALFYVGMGLTWGLAGFIAMFLGVMTHCMGDIIAGQRPDGSPYGLRPLWPFSKIEVGWGLLKASDKRLNDRLVYIGVICLMVYILITI